jgi:hypothetical protein
VEREIGLFWNGLILAAAFSVSLAGATSIASAACTNIQYKCAVQTGGTFDPKTNRWKIRNSQSRIAAFNDCVSRNLATPIRRLGSEGGQSREECKRKAAEGLEQDIAACNQRFQSRSRECRQIQNEDERQRCLVTALKTQHNCRTTAETKYHTQVKKCNQL